MNDFLFLFRRSETESSLQSPEQMQAITQKWMDWVGEIKAAGKLVDRGNRLLKGGNVLAPGGLVTDGPFMELKEAVGGYIMVRSDDLAGATELAKGCPILKLGGKVEVRQVDSMGE